jgi:hypothetical protein
MSKYTSNLGLFPYVKPRSPACLDTVDTTTDWQITPARRAWIGDSKCTELLLLYSTQYSPVLLRCNKKPALRRK